MRKINQFLIFSTFTTETNLSIFSSKSESDQVTTRSVVLTNKITKSDTTTYFRTSSNTTKIHSPTSINDVEEPNKTTNRLTSEIFTTKTNLKQNSTQNKLVTTKITDLIETSVIAKKDIKSSNNILRKGVKTEKINSENNTFVFITAVLSAVIAVVVLLTIVKKLVKDLIFFKCFFSLKH